MNKSPRNAPVDGVLYFNPRKYLDDRGSFTKFWSAQWHDGLPFSSTEFFYSDSLPGVIRGLHLQIGEAACARYVSVIAGKILDVVLDLRPNSPTFLNLQSTEMDSLNNSTVFIPAGVAHGFQALELAKTLYISEKIHEPNLDSGVNSKSFEFQWPLDHQVRSKRDKSLPSLSRWLEEYS